ncbi:protease HtpX [Neisseria sp. Ec49-e6-T10]|uniref:protease HtpX n=1 Tax=Neisseria sp. Ec49-e6-T10 TaxID=3140744 RepID=UPI003EBC0100
MKRVSLFVLTNMAIMVVLGILMNIIFGLTGFRLDQSSMVSLLVICSIFGFSGSLISLFLSKGMAKRSVGAQVITDPRNETERWLYQTIERQAQTLNIKMPEVAIYQAAEMNAFATGATKNKSLVAVSTGLLNQMTKDEVEAVLAHEMSHIHNGDMVTMTLLQGMVNTFAMFIAQIITIAITSFLRGNQDSERSSGSILQHHMIYMLVQMIFTSLGSLIVMWFSRHREYHADAGAARLVGAPKMIAALKRLAQPLVQTEGLPDKIEAFGINGVQKDSLLSTHPSIPNRIDALENQKY